MERRTETLAMTGVVATVLLALVGVFLGARLIGGTDAADGDRVELAEAQNPPPTDVFVRFQPRAINGALARAQLAEGLSGGTIDEASVEWVGTLHGPSGETNVFRFRQTMAEFAGDMHCVGMMTADGGSTSCRRDNDPVPSGPHISGGSSGDDWRAVEVEGVPAEALWIVVTTDKGATIAANTIEGLGVVEWDASLGIGRSATLLTKGFEEIWSESIEFD